MSSTARCSNRSATGRSLFFKALPIAPSYSSELPIAFSKIEGFDVTPLTPSVSISALRSPLATKPRARKSSQIAWPWFSSALTGFMGPVLFGRFFGFPALSGAGPESQHLVGLTAGWNRAVRHHNAIGAGSIPKMAGLAGLDTDRTGRTGFRDGDTNGHAHE